MLCRNISSNVKSVASGTGFGAVCSAVGCCDRGHAGAGL